MDAPTLQRYIKARDTISLRAKVLTVSLASMWAPCASSSATVSAWPWTAALCRDVMPCSSAAFTLAPLFSRSFTSCMCPCRAAKCSGVRPPWTQEARSLHPYYSQDGTGPAVTCKLVANPTRPLRAIDEQNSPTTRSIHSISRPWCIDSHALGKLHLGFIPHLVCCPGVGTKLEQLSCHLNTSTIRCEVQGSPPILQHLCP